MNAATKRYYVKAITSKKDVTGYGVYDCVGGLESQHADYMLADHDGKADIALLLANQHRDDLNREIE